MTYWLKSVNRLNHLPLMRVVSLVQGADVNRTVMISGDADRSGLAGIIFRKWGSYLIQLFYF